jgi:hypothetical protein
MAFDFAALTAVLTTVSGVLAHIEVSLSAPAAELLAAAARLEDLDTDFDAARTNSGRGRSSSMARERHRDREQFLGRQVDQGAGELIV